MPEIDEDSVVALSEGPRNEDGELRRDFVQEVGHAIDVQDLSILAGYWGK